MYKGHMNKSKILAGLKGIKYSLFENTNSEDEVSYIDLDGKEARPIFKKIDTLIKQIELNQPTEEWVMLITFKESQSNLTLYQVRDMLHLPKENEDIVIMGETYFVAYINYYIGDEGYCVDVIVEKYKNLSGDKESEWWMRERSHQDYFTCKLK